MKPAGICMCVFRLCLSLWSSAVVNRLCHKPFEAVACVRAIKILNDCSEEFIVGNKVLFPRDKEKKKAMERSVFLHLQLTPFHLNVL